LVTD